MSVYSNSASGSPDETRAYVTAVLGLLGSQDPFDVLRRTPAALRQVVAGCSPEQLARPETPGKWSMQQVLRHLADSDLVWGFRLRMILAHDRPQITGYDQDKWADRLHYADADAEESLAEFEVLSPREHAPGRPRDAGRAPARRRTRRTRRGEPRACDQALRRSRHPSPATAGPHPRPCPTLTPHMAVSNGLTANRQVTPMAGQ